MHTNRQILNKGIKYLAWALPLFFLGPSIIYNAFQNDHTNWHYVVLAAGIVVCFLAVFFTFKGLNTIMKSLFGK